MPCGNEAVTRLFLGAALLLFPSGAPRVGRTLATISSDTATCFPDTTGLSTPDTAFLGLALGPMGPDTAYSALDDDLLVGQAIRENFRPPTNVTLPFWARFAPLPGSFSVGDGPVGGGVFATDLRFELGRDGRLADAKVSIKSAAPELNASLEAAVRRADSMLAFPFRAKGPKKRHVVFHLVDYRHRPAPTVTLMRLVIPTIQVQTPVEVVSQPRPQYPRLAQTMGVASSVNLQYVVEVDGRVDPTSFYVVKAEYREFVTSAINTVLGSRFVAATVRGCPVPLLVQQKVSFNIGN